MTDSAVALSSIAKPTTTTVSPGSKFRVSVSVDYSRRRSCDLLMSRYLLDSSGTYFDLMATRHLSVHGLTEIERATPHEFRFMVQIPAEVSLGNGFVITQISSMCNPLQVVWPVSIDIHTPITVTDPGGT